jgi:hypothetical protein
MACLTNREETRLVNETFFEKIASTDASMQKEAMDALNDFTRTTMREEGVLRRIMPPITITNDEIDRVVETDKPVVIVDKEPGSPAAVSIPFNDLPINFYIRGPRYKVTFSRTVSPRFQKDVDELRSWKMDIRQVLSDNAIKDMMAEEDTRLFEAVETALGGAANVTLAASGKVQWKELAGGIDRDGLWEMMTIMPDTPFHLETHTVVLNNLTIKKVAKFRRDEMGGDLSQDIMKNGWTEQNFMGVRWIITIKTNLVQTNRFYHFADPKFIGKFLMINDVTMYAKSEAYLLEFFAYELYGATIGHNGGLAIADFI